MCYVLIWRQLYNVRVNFISCTQLSFIRVKYNQSLSIRESNSHSESESINRQMSEEMLLNDRRGNLIHGFSLDQFFFMGAKTFAPTVIRTSDLSIHAPPPTHCAMSHLILLCCNRFHISNFGALEITHK